MSKWIGVLLVCNVILAQPAFAQEVRARGREAVTMGASSNSVSIGYWHKMTDENSIGGDFSVFFRDREHSDQQSYQFSPGIRHYLMPQQAVSPYLYAALIGRYGENSSKSGDSSSSSESYTVGLQGGVGLEWFPVQRLSIAGHVGVSAQYEKTHSLSTFNGSTTTGPSFSSSNTDEGFAIGTISSGILLNLYF